MFGQMTAGSWIYIGSQGIVQGTYETFVEAGRQHFNGEWQGRWILTAGLGGMGGAQPLAATMAGASMLAVECNPSRIAMRLSTRYLDVRAENLDQALAMIASSRAAGKAISVGLLGNAADVFAELAQRTEAGDASARPDLVTDQTSAHDPLNGYLPRGWTLEQAEHLRQSDPDSVIKAAKASMAEQVESMLRFFRAGIPTVGLRQQHPTDGARRRRRRRVRLPRLCAGLYPAAVLPWRWAVSVGGAVR